MLDGFYDLLCNNSWQEFQSVVQTFADEEFDKVDVQKIRELLDENVAESNE